MFIESKVNYGTNGIIYVTNNSNELKWSFCAKAPFLSSDI